MNKYDVAEISYNNGYKQGVKDLAERVKKEMDESKYRLVESHYARACNSVIDFWIVDIDQITKEMGVEL